MMVLLSLMLHACGSGRRTLDAIDVDPIGPGHPPIDADFGDIDSTALIDFGIAYWKNVYPQPVIVNWFVPVAHFKRNGSNDYVRGLDEDDEWELAVLLGDLEIEEVDDEGNGTGRWTKSLCITFFVHKGIDSDPSPWMFGSPYFSSLNPIEFYLEPIHMEDVAAYVERVAYHMFGKEECAPIEAAPLRNWDSLFGARPRFAYPICN